MMATHDYLYHELGQAEFSVQGLSVQNEDDFAATIEIGRASQTIIGQVLAMI
jgi:hypothetical protein